MPAQTLDVSDNMLGWLDDITGLKQAPQLTSLILAGHQLFPAFPEFVCAMSSLRHLAISGKYLREIPDSIGQLSALTSLAITQTAIQTLPGGMAQLGSLQSLDLSDNECLVHIPNVVLGMTQLARLILPPGVTSPLTTNSLRHQC